ncbi:porin family protein [uncultured Duncaniella sp.]|uniref:porin family protein n=1 Tax=uncultured Duncaniella sp. TaxID=2768039 RepID=UPI0025F0B6CF|nr:porin family protein [uncultured Duncaniella sp.]
MKSIKALLLLFVMVIGASAIPAQAQFKFGPKVGLTVNDFHFNKSVVDAENQTGWTAGLMAEFTVPVIGISADLSAMYVRRNTKFLEENEMSKDNRDYIEIPLNIKYKFGLPVVSKFLVPYVGVGPSVSFLTSRRHISDAYKNKSVDWALNFGFGVQLLSHIDLNARYGLGLTKAVTAVSGADNAGIEGKNRYWTISLAYLF